MENRWSKIKVNMRKSKARTVALLPEVIRKAFSFTRMSDCIGWFHVCAYMQNFI